MTLNFKILKELSSDLTLLYVEDNALLREKTAFIFKNLFKDVTTGIDGEDALNLYKEYSTCSNKNYDIVVSDIQMPRLNGIELSKEIFKLNPDQNIIIVSAYNDIKYLIELINIGVKGFMQKPFSTDNMLSVLYNVCNSLSAKNIIALNDTYSFNSTTSSLLCNDIKIELSENELKLLELLIKNKKQSFSAIDIFNNLYVNEPDKEFSNDSIKSLVKRLRKKVPENFILNTQQLGYSANF